MSWLAESQRRVDDFLDKALPPAGDPPGELHEAMRYALFSEGKRVRPALAFATARACKDEPDRVLPVAGAAELVHAYSLVHDDLPAMDDDEVRRGQPTVHVRFGEATAILTGDALLAAAFEVLAGGDVPAEVVARLARAAGSRALVGGQIDDLAYPGGGATREAIESIHRRKTGALFDFAVWAAGRVCAASGEELRALEHFAEHYGVAFQLVDDLLDADFEECTILLVMTESEARAEIARRTEAAREALTPFGPRAELLLGLAETVAARLP